MPKTCKNCGQPFLGSLIGLRAFCSEVCREAYRRNYQKKIMRASRGVSNRDSTATMETATCEHYVNCNPSKTNDRPPSGYGVCDVPTGRCSERFIDHDWRATGETISCARCGVTKNPAGKKTALTPEDFGGREWYLMAKDKCCNFDLRNKGGFCFDLKDPHRTFRLACSECSLGRAIFLREKKKAERNRLRAA